MIDPVVAVALSLAVLSAYYRADFQQYSVFTVGAFRRVSRSVVTGSEYECVDDYCDATVETAERRRWYKEIVVFGMVLVRYDGGEHHYCEDHASFEVRNDWDEPTRARTQRIALTAAELIGEFASAMPDDFGKSKNDDPLGNANASVAAGVSSALSLLPIVFLVLVAAVAMRGMKQLRG